MGYRRLLGLVPQDLALFDDLGCAQNLSFFGRLYGLAGRALKRRVEEVLDLVRLADVARRPVRTFSGGMKRRLNLACAVLHRPALLLLDEPTVGLDLAARDAVFAILRRLRDEGCGLVFATHHLEEAERLCDRVAILDRGTLLALGTLDELYTLCESTRPSAQRRRWTSCILGRGRDCPAKHAWSDCSWT